MLSLIGETLQDEDDVCGAVVSVRKAQDRIAIWSATANAEDRQKAIGRGFRQALVDLGKNETLIPVARRRCGQWLQFPERSVRVTLSNPPFRLYGANVFCLYRCYRLYEA